MRKKFQLIIVSAGLCITANLSCKERNINLNEKSKRPNILFVIADDQSFPYTSAYGTTGIHTPAFDEVAKNGMLFYNAFAAAPQCSPSRAAILTGKDIWQLAEAGTHSSNFPKGLKVFTDILESAGYEIGYTGKPWSPGNWKVSGWKRNPAGPAYNKEKLMQPTTGISNIDYYKNFVDFYSAKKEGQPFFFWFGSNEPHRLYQKGSAVKSGKKPMNAFVPGFLPDDSVVRSDIADYTLEIEWYDSQLKKMIDFLRQKGELNNTLIVVTSDNGMPFPSAKANLTEYGLHVPLAISWPGKIKRGVVSYDLVSLIDLAPTFLQIAGVKNLPPMTGKGLNDILFRDSVRTKDIHRQYVLTGRERHSDSRPDDVGYPSRAIRTKQFLFIINLKPERWPAGNPPPDKRVAIKEEDQPSEHFVPIGLGYCDIDGSPSKTLMIKDSAKWTKLFAEGFGKRPAEQLYDIQRDPGCTTNLAADATYDSVKDVLKAQLIGLLTQEGDPRMLGYGDVFDGYPRYGVMRNWGGFQKKGTYNPAFEPKKNIINQ